jgi:asparagine synthase (glutamine-hydrolysing)
MSAIWGIIDFNQNKISQKEQNIMEKPFHKCKIDRFEQKVHNNVYMGCGIQYFTKESEYECLPMMALEHEYCFDADVVLDNREELCERLNIEETSTLSDGAILAEMFHLYGTDCLNELLGAYAFVYYDIKHRSASLVIDATGNRFIYYRMYEGKLYYSSLMEPLVMLGDQAAMNERWISDFLALDNTMTISELEDTPVEGIYRVAPGQIVRVDQTRILKQTYWDPIKDFKELKLLNDEAYAMQFRSLFEKAVSCMLRSRGETGILLSGGLDSTAVACIAAPILKDRNKNLYSYTSVPIEEYQSRLPSYKITNEKSIVEKTKEYLGNIICTFIDIPEVNSWDNRREKMKYYEFPYKSVLNVHWIWESMNQAEKSNIKIMLSGAGGNSSISFANPQVYINHLFSHMRFIKLWKELCTFKCTRGISRRHVLKATLHNFLSRTTTQMDSVLEKSYIREEMYRKHKVKERLSKMYDNIEKAEKNFSDFRNILCNKLMYRQMGEAEAKRSLYTGVLQRDPTRDKRIIEFCLHLPIDQFIKNGEERRLVNVYLSDIMPKHVINVGSIGVQGADLTFRISKHWDRIREEWLAGYYKHMDNIFVDCNKAISRIEQMKLVDDYKEFDMVRHIYTNMVLEYIDNMQDICKQNSV